MMDIYEKFRSVPETAKREIEAGRLKGKTDINPMWRIKALTEAFGPCGIGWKYKIVREWLEHGANGEIAAFMDIELYYKLDGEWSEAIPGTGGSAFVAKERTGLYTSDECYKMALTDAISVACKALGIGADVYWQADSTKYTRSPVDDAIRDDAIRSEIVSRVGNKNLADAACMKRYGKPLAQLNTGELSQIMDKLDEKKGA